MEGVIVGVLGVVVEGVDGVVVVGVLGGVVVGVNCVVVVGVLGVVVVVGGGAGGGQVNDLE